MKKITSKIYKEYPEQPYISSERDLRAWEENPELFPYDIVSKLQMQRFPEGLLPGDIIMLWRIHFNTFTNTSVFPQYFEYKYGVYGPDSVQLLFKLGFAEECSATDSLVSLNMPMLKKILVNKNLDTKGKKADVLQRIVDHIPEDELAKLFTLRKYAMTPIGEEILEKYDAIIQKHGLKSM